MSWSISHSGSVNSLRRTLDDKLDQAKRHNPEAVLSIDAAGAFLENLMGNEAVETVISVSISGHRAFGQPQETVSMQIGINRAETRR